MTPPGEGRALALLGLLRSPLLVVSLALLVTMPWLPYVYSANYPHPVGEGVVVETIEHGDTVVRLDSGSYVAVRDLDAAPGEHTSVYVTDWDDPVASGSREVPYLLTPLLGVLGTLLASMGVVLLGLPLLDRLERRLRRSP